jgi:MFS family permease
MVLYGEMIRPLRGIGMLFGTHVPRTEHMLLLLVGSSLLIKNYDLAIFGLATPQIQASLGIPEESLGLYVSLVRLGVLAAFPLAYFADSFGRQRLFLVTIAGMTVATLLTAFAQSPWEYVVLQLIARGFAYAEEMLCFVIVAEEVGAARRGWAFGWLAALGGLGTGLAAIVYAAVDYLPHGWRGYYVIGAFGLAIIMLARQRLRETCRFESRRAARPPAEGIGARLEPIAELVRAHPRRFCAMAAVTIPFAFGMEPATFLVSKYVQTELHFPPAYVSLMYLLGGIPLLGCLLAGPLSDRFGRRVVMGAAMVAAPALFALFYIATNPYAIVALWATGMLAWLAAEVTISGVGSELFPTACRATASGARVIVAIAAGVLGLAAESALYGIFGSHGAAILCLLAVPPLGLAGLWLGIPETASRELEDIAPDMELVKRPSGADLERPALSKL